MRIGGAHSVRKTGPKTKTLVAGKSLFTKSAPGACDKVLRGYTGETNYVKKTDRLQFTLRRERLLQKQRKRIASKKSGLLALAPLLSLTRLSEPTGAKWRGD